MKPDGGPAAVCWVSPDRPLPRFYACCPRNGAPPSIGIDSMVVFLAPDEAAGGAAHAAGLAAGGRDDGAPGPRPRYGEGYHGARLRDPDGNKVHVVHRGGLTEPPAVG